MHLPAVLLIDTITPQLAIRPGNRGQILISSNIEIAPAILGPDKRQQDNIRIHTAHEDTNDQAILVARNLALGRQRKLLADSRLDGGRGRRHEVAELVRRADDKGAERARRELHEVDGNHAPRALDAELLEKGRCDDGVAAGEGVRV